MSLSSNNESIKVVQKYIGYDDDENSLIHQLINKVNLNECYRILFKLTEKNGEDFVWNFIIKVFLDFYAELNPKMENFIFKIKKDKTQKSTTSFIYIIKNMFIRRSISYNVYNARTGVLSYKYTIPVLKNKKIEYGQSHDKQINDNLKLLELIKKYGNKYSVLLNALHAKNIDKVSYKIFNHLNDGDDVDILHKIIVGYFSFIYFNDAFSENEVYCEPNEKVFEKWLNIKENITSKVYLNYLIAIVIHLFAEEININQSILFVRPNLEEEENIKSH